MVSRQAERDDDRGRSAELPRDIPRRGWRDILLRVWEDLGKDNLSVISAGVAFYSLLALFPAMAALVSIYGFAVDPATVQRQFQALTDLLPPEAANIIGDQMKALVSAPKQQLSLGVVVGLLLTLWSATSGVKTLFTALNICYKETEKRGFFRFNGEALLVTLIGIIVTPIVLSLVIAVPAAINILNLGPLATVAVSLVRWVLLAVLIMAVLAVLYRYGPSRDEPRWHWVSWGAAIAAVLWLITSAMFSWYVANFAGYNKTYGTLGAGVILLMWLYLTNYIVLLGAEINAEMEHQTEKDTTHGAPRPMGERNAYVADTIGKSPQ